MKITRERRTDVFCKLGDAYCVVMDLLKDYPEMLGQVYDVLKSITELQTTIAAMELDELLSFAQAFPDEQMLITDPDLPF